jgi:hypothetical protein
MNFSSPGSEPRRTSVTTSSHHPAPIQLPREEEVRVVQVEEQEVQERVETPDDIAPPPPAFDTSSPATEEEPEEIREKQEVQHVGEKQEVRHAREEQGVHHATVVTVGDTEPEVTKLNKMQTANIKI